MRYSKLSELQPGNVFTRKMVLHNREAFIVEKKPEGKEYLFARSRITNEVKKVSFKNDSFVVVLSETDKLPHDCKNNLL